MVRTLLGKRTTLGRVQAVFQTADALEIDDLEYFHVRRTRLFYDEIQLLTYHQRADVAFVVGCTLILLFVTMVASIVGLAAEDWLVAGLLFGALGAPALVLGIVRLILKVDVVTASGKRTSAQMEFGFRKARAREVYQRLARLTRESQEGLARELAAEEPPAASA